MAVYRLPLDEEVKVNSKREIRSDTDLTGKITYANDYFIELSGYSENELVNHPHNIIRHPDMPKIVFQTLWKNILLGRKYKAIVKNFRKDRKYYWVYAEYEPLFDENQKLRGFRSIRWPINKKTVEDIEKIYEKLLSIEKSKNVEESEKMLNAVLMSLGFDDYSDYIESVRKTRFENMFSFFGKLFGK
jgi:PAS domain S-box-containing protein